MGFEAVLFDCDGVLVDSEGITNEVFRLMLRDRGWELDAAECLRIFAGKAVRDEAALIEQRTGQPLTEDWLAEFRNRRNAALLEQVQAVPGVQPAVRRIHQRLEGRIACASGADRLKVELMLRHIALIDLFEGRIFSGQELARSKPHPDVYLEAARVLRVDPARCAVIEDTVVGVRAGVAAGATVLAYAAPSPAAQSPEALRAAGAHRVFTDMAQLPELVL